MKTWWPWKREVVERGTEEWKKQTTYNCLPIGDPRFYQRDYVLYKITNRWTGSETLKKTYLT